MGFFGFGKKKEQSTPVCSCQCGTNTEPVQQEPQTCSCNGSPITSIQVLGTGCTSCHTLLEHTQQAVSNLGLSVQVEYVQDMVKIASYGVMRTPALMVNGQVVATGRVLSVADVEAILKNTGNHPQ